MVQVLTVTIGEIGKYLMNLVSSINILCTLSIYNGVSARANPQVYEIGSIFGSIYEE